MDYQFRTITNDDRRELLNAQLRAAELDILRHGNMADMATASGDHVAAAGYTEDQAGAIARAELAAATLDALDAEPAPPAGDQPVELPVAPVEATPVEAAPVEAAPVEAPKPAPGETAPEAAQAAAEPPTP